MEDGGMDRRILLPAAILSPAALPAADLPPIACNLKALTADERAELSHLARHAAEAITASHELKDGYAFQIDPAKASLVEVARWLDLWRRCCPFYEFRIDFHAADAGIRLWVTGRPGVKEFIPVDSPVLAAKLRK